MMTAGNAVDLYIPNINPVASKLATPINNFSLPLKNRAMMYPEINEPAPAARDGRGTSQEIPAKLI